MSYEDACHTPAESQQPCIAGCAVSDAKRNLQRVTGRHPQRACASLQSLLKLPCWRPAGGPRKRALLQANEHPGGLVHRHGRHVGLHQLQAAVLEPSQRRPAVQRRAGSAARLAHYEGERLCIWWWVNSCGSHCSLTNASLTRRQCFACPHKGFSAGGTLLKECWCRQAETGVLKNML